MCSGRTGHAEVVLVEYNPAVVTTEELLDVFWKSHDPTQVSHQDLDLLTADILLRTYSDAFILESSHVEFAWTCTYTKWTAPKSMGQAIRFAPLHSTRSLRLCCLTQLVDLVTVHAHTACGVLTVTLSSCCDQSFFRFICHRRRAVE